MATYKAPVRDMQFVLHELLDVQGHFAQIPGGDQATPDIIDAILEESAKLCETVLFPLNQSGDEEGCLYRDREVRTPSGFKEAYGQYVAGGWLALACDEEHGGQGLPHTLSVMCEEMLHASNMSLALYPGLSRGAYVALSRFGSEELKKKYLPKIVDGTWAGVMCLTESHCGTDLGLLRTRAAPAEDGSYRVTGSKIFITGGEQDLTENILHLVLARLPDAPPGVKGISMFLVPKFLVNEDGSLGERNQFHCGSIEKKMGIKGASTCVMNYEGAAGYLVGAPHRGLQTMFAMMNHERVMVGQQGLAQGEVAYQSAVAYARERVQGRAPDGAKFPDRSADPIIVHPDVRRMLFTARAYNEAERALIAFTSLQVDFAERHPDPEARQAGEELAALLTPVVKALFTDCGTEVCNLCLQVFGGHGYIKEWGMEQLVRDARIAQIYEGANGVHALDLVKRKLPFVDRYLGLVREFVAENQDDPTLAEFVGPVAAGVDKVAEATDWIRRAGKNDPNETGAASYDYLQLVGLTAFAHMWAMSAKVALPKVEGDNTGFYKAKVATARFFMNRLFPRTSSLLESLRSGGENLMALEAEAF